MSVKEEAALEKWMKICTPAYVETDILNITHQFKEFCKSNHIKIMAAIQNASEKEYKKAIEVHPDLVNLDRPELFIKILHQEIKK
jgi:glycerophosphoryl diester phosphodiesterase